MNPSQGGPPPAEAFLAIRIKMTKKLLGDSKEDLRLVIKEYKELENIGRVRAMDGPESGLGGCVRFCQNRFELSLENLFFSM